MTLSPSIKISAFVIAINHIIGLIGLNTPEYEDTLSKTTWVNLLITYLLICFTYTHVWRNLAIYTAVVFFIGMLAEIIGVHTGILFGSYYYTDALGIQFLGVPLIIGINWAMLVYITGSLSGKLVNKHIVAIVLGATFMVMIDIALEKFAIRHSLWVWGSNLEPPLQNYIGWFLVSIPAHAAFRYYKLPLTNPLAYWYAFVLIVFLLADYCVSLMML